MDCNNRSNPLSSSQILQCKNRWDVDGNAKTTFSLSDLEELDFSIDRWISIAVKENVDVSNEMRKIMQIKRDAPAIQDEETGLIREVTLVQQFVLRNRYLQQMSKKVITAIREKNRWELKTDTNARYSLWDLEQLDQTTSEWIAIAQRDQVEVTKQIYKIQQIKEDSPSIRNDETGLIREATLVQQFVWRNIFLNQIIRKITKQNIIRTAEAGKLIPELQKKIGLIEQCKKWLLVRLPRKVDQQHYSITEQKCRWLLYKMEEMQSKICR